MVEIYGKFLQRNLKLKLEKLLRNMNKKSATGILKHV